MGPPTNHAPKCGKKMADQRNLSYSAGNNKYVSPDRLNRFIQLSTEKAIAAARKIRFIPAMRNGRPVSVHMQLEYNFNLY